MMDGTTCLSELPSHNSSNNINIDVKDVGVSEMNNEMMLDNSTINQIVSGLKNSKVSFELPSRDIPLNTDTHVNDEQVQPNYIPSHTKNDYIKEVVDEEGYLEKQRIHEHRISSVNDFYEELQMPLLVAVLYFLFQLPAFRKFLHKQMPFIYLADGNMNIQGYLTTSLCFAVSYYSLTKAIVLL